MEIASNISDWARRHKFLVLLMAVWASLIYAGGRHYAGSLLTYWVFGAVSLASLLFGLASQRIYSYFFFVIFLFLGFWFKLTAHLSLFGYFCPSEATGGFKGAPHEWDTVLCVAIAALVGALLGRLVWFGYSVSFQRGQFQIVVPHWYESVRKLLWVGLGLSIFAAALINVLYGVHQVGLVPRTIFPWPANAVLAWSLNIGCALAIAVLTAWDISSGRKLSWQPYVMVTAAFISSVAIMSRALFLFQTVAQLFSLKVESRGRHYTRRQIALFLGFTFILFMTSIAAVSLLRDSSYVGASATPLVNSLTNRVTGSRVQCIDADRRSDDNKTEPVSSIRAVLLYQLIINRWIGLEGVMATSTYEGRGIELLQKLGLEKREVGKATEYQKISQSGYQADDSNFQFASVVGIAGFMYLGGSLWVVVIGVAFLVSLAIAGEWMLAQLTRNPLFCSLYGITAANTLAQFGVTPRQDLPQYMMIFSMGLLIYVLQSRFRRKIPSQA